MMTESNFTIRTALKADLKDINSVIESAIMSWQLPERVKRLSLSSYRYDELDFNYLDIVVAEDDSNNIVGVAAWEQADNKDTPDDQTALLLHGIYVDPSRQHQGIGSQLFQSAEQAVRNNACNGLLVKAQSDANDFFIAQGMSQLKTNDDLRQYANRFWKSIV